MVTVEQTFFLNQFPKPLDQVEVGAVGRKKEQFNVQRGRLFLGAAAMLRAGVVEDQGDEHVGMREPDLLPQFTHGSGMDMALGGDLDDLLAMAIQRPQHAVTLASRPGLDKDAL